MKLLTILAVLLLSSTHALASESRAKIDRLNLDRENARWNKAEYEKNLTVVENNITKATDDEAKAKTELDKVDALVTEHDGRLEKLKVQKEDLLRLEEIERSGKAAEVAEIDKLKARLAELEQRQVVREENLQKIRTEKEKLKLNNESWVSHKKLLNNQKKQAEVQLVNARTNLSKWKNKKTGYAGEIRRWEREISRADKRYNTYTNLANNKDSN